MTEKPRHGAVIWNELNTHDPAAAMAFYAKLMGWSFAPMPMEDGEYWIIKHADKDLGGVFPLSAPEFRDVPSHWLTYLAVDDVDASIVEVEKLGGTVTKAPFDVPGVGRLAVVQDPSGAHVAWITPSM